MTNPLSVVHYSPSSLVKALDLSNTCQTKNHTVSNLQECRKIFHTVSADLECHPELMTPQETRLLQSQLSQALDLAYSKAQIVRLESFDPQEKEIALDMEKYLTHNKLPDNPYSQSAEALDEVQRLLENMEENNNEFDTKNMEQQRHSVAGNTSYFSRMQALLHYIADNSTSTTAGRHACNVANVVTRNVASVMAPTFLRQGISYGVASLLQTNNASLATQYALSITAASLPLLLNAVGFAVDNWQGTATQKSQICRALNIAIGTGAIITAGATGVLPGLAAPLIAFNSYCMMRDITQAFLKLKDDTKGMDPETARASAACFAGNQTLVGIGMDVLGSPSGAGAIASATEYSATVCNDLIRSVINTCGETVDDLTIRGIQNHREGQPMQIKFETSLPTSEDAIKIATRQLAGRTSTFNTAVLISAAVSTITDQLGGLAGIAAGNAVTGAVIGGEYLLFMDTVTSQKDRQPQVTDYRTVAQEDEPSGPLGKPG